MPSSYASKAEFVRSLPELSVDEVITQGRTAGLKVTRADVYSARHANAKKSEKPQRLIDATRPAKRGAAQAETERTFHEVVRRMGLDRAQELLASMEQTFLARLT